MFEKYTDGGRFLVSNNFNDATNSFEISDYLMAREVFVSWQAKESEELEDWLIRQRKEELYALVRRVIKNEFSKEDKLLIDLKWYKGLSAEEISKKTGISRAGVYRRIDKINDILYEKLKYAMEYRFGIKERTPVVAVLCDVKSRGEGDTAVSVAARLRSLRAGQHISLSDLSRCTGIAEARLSGLEKYAGDLSSKELIKLSSFYKASTDFILFGKSRILRDPYTGLPFDYKC